ncbi:MAG: ferrous iron transport protein B [Alcanivoracaceae bacterium]|nr:ferrous iron transport protein B [Alcanivoracaceae bacterium]
MSSSEKPLVALIGNPNCGKTTLFNQLTGLSKKTGNWSGVTVHSQYCAVNYNELDYNLVDLPGIYALSIESQGQDELHVQEFLQKQNPDLIVNVVNAASLERGLFLTLELLSFDVKVITVLNMWDEAQAQSLNIDTKNLAEILQSNVLPMVAKTGKGIATLKDHINKLLQTKTRTQINKAITNDKDDDVTFNLRLKQAQNICAQVLSLPEINKKYSNNILDYLTTHPVWGLFSFFFAMYVMFFFAINVSAVFIDFFDIATGAILINGGHQIFDVLGFPQSLSVILADGIGGGVQTVATFIPVIGFLYLVLTWLEDSGYMARAAFVMNGLMRKIGLSGQAFVPLIVSFGCNVPAIMATRSLPSRREKLVTIMMAPFMSCGARLSVYALFVAAFFSQNATSIVFALYFIGILVAVLTGLMLQKTILPGKAEPFLIELPPWRIPTIKNLMLGTWRRLKGFLLDAGKIIIIMVMLIQVLNSIGADFSWGNEDSEHSMLSATAKAVVPVFEPMGIEEKNWPAIVGILTGILAKEVVVGTLDAIYTSLEKQAENTDQDDPSIKQQLITAVVSIKDNAIGLGDLLLDPLGLSIAATGSDTQMAANQDVSDSLFGIIRDRFSDKYAAFAYLLFILLYFPCVAATAAIAREAGTKWAVFSGLWSTGLAYMVATNFYQLSHFANNPLFASLWLLAFISMIAGVYFYLKRVGKRADPLKLKVL